MKKNVSKISLIGLMVIFLFIFSCQKQSTVLGDKSATPKQKRITKIEQIKKEMQIDVPDKNDSLALEVYKNYTANNTSVEGIEFLEKFYEKNSQNDSILYILAIENYKLKKLDEALGYLQKLKASHKYSSTADNLIFAIIGKKEKADKAYSEGFKKYQAAEYDQAVISFQSGLRVQADHFNCAYYKNLSQALSYIEKGDQVSIKFSVDLLETAAKIQPDNGLTYYYLAKVNAMKLNRNNKMIADYYELSLKNKLDGEYRLKVSEEYNAFKNEVKNKK